MSFWTNNPCSPSWSSFASAWWNKTPLQLLCANPWAPTVKPIASLQLRKGRVEDARAIVEFWNRFYSTSASSKCFFPADVFCRRLLKGVWEVYVVVHPDSGELIGTITRRWIQSVQIGDAVLPRAGLVDYFCVHPAWRKKGVGNWLLTTLHHTGMRSPAPCPPHFFLWEGVNLRIPSFCTGFFYNKRGAARGTLPTVSKDAFPAAWASIQAECSIRAGGVPNEEDISVYPVKGAYVAIQNTFHRSIPDGARIGVILGDPDASLIETVLEEGGYGILLHTSYHQGWSMDSPYQWVAYNLQLNTLFGQFPCLL